MPLTRALSAVAVTALAAGGLVAAQPAHAALAPGGGAAAAERALLAASDQPPTIRKDRTGVIRSVTAKAGHPLRRPVGIAAGAGADAAARGFLTSYAAGFGLRDGGSALKTVRTDRTKEGDRIVRFQQQVDGVPVIGGDVVVATKANGDVLGATSEVTAETDVQSDARISKDRATSQALAAVAKVAKVKPRSLRGEASRWMFDPRMIGGAGAPGLRPVWQVEVRGERSSELDRLVLVDATVGTVTLMLDLHAEAKNRLVCDYQNTIPPGGDAVCEQSNAVRVEGGPASSVFDVNRAYDNAGATYDFYAANFGRDSIDGNGMPLRSSVRVCVPGEDGCPYQNAFWDGQKMVYGAGMSWADDVVAHELTHGVTEYTSNLFYAYQSGAINESLSDIFGEFVDQTYTPAGTKDGAAYDWQLGEDLPASIGVIRNMADPTKILFPGDIPDPDRMASPHYFVLDVDGDGMIEDNGGVHINSGVGNKAAYLITAPGTRTFNGVSVTGLGIPKAAQIYYRTELLLTSGADYADLAAALDSACQQLATAGTAGITAADCTQVRNAATATEMTKQPTSPGGQAPEAPICPAGATPNVIAGDDMEAPNAGKWNFSAANWYHLDPARFGVGYAHSGKIALVGDTKIEQGDPLPKSASATFATPIAVPADKTTYLWFAHVRMFEQDGTKFFDGGRVEYRANGGQWTDAGPLFTYHGYNGNLQPDAGVGTGRFFVSDSHGYMSSRLDLSSLAGKSVELRFSVYGDTFVGSSWVIDDVKAYTCSAAKTGAVRNLKAVGGLWSATLSWARPDVDGPAPITEYQISSSPAVTGLPKTVPASQFSAAVPNLAANQTYTFTVTPLSGTVAGTPANLVVKPTTVALTRSAATVVYGRTVTLNGQVNVVGGGVATGGTARILGRAKGTTTWNLLGTAGVGTTGKFSFNHVPNPGFDYVAHFIGGVNLQGVGSGIATVAVAPQVSIASSASTVKRGTVVRFTGNTVPARRYMPFALQVFSGGAWRTIASGKTYYAGSYAIAAKLSTAGTFSYRVVVNGDALYAPGISASKVIKVT